MKTIVCSLMAFAALFVGCAKPPAEEYLKKASDAEKAGLWSVALENYQNLLRDHPGHALAEMAAFNIPAIQQNNLQNFQAAIAGYKSFQEKYPEAKKAPTALFLTAFLYHNEIKNLDSARFFYQDFLTKYPNHEMALSAQFELQNLGKSPDEILSNSSVAETTPPSKSKQTPAKSKKN